MVAVRSCDGGRLAAHPAAVQFLRDKGAYGIHCALVQGRVPDDAAGAYVSRLEFKLGLDEHQGVTPFLQQGESRGQDFFREMKETSETIRSTCSPMSSGVM